MKICLVSPYDFMHPGGVTEHVRHLSAKLRDRGHAVTGTRQQPRCAHRRHVGVGGIQVVDGCHTASLRGVGTNEGS